MTNSGSPAGTFYNALGQVASTTDDAGRVTAYKYDALGRETLQQCYANQADATAEIDPTGPEKGTSLIFAR